MINSMFRDVSVSFKPFADAAEINTATTSKLVQMQAAFVSDMLTAGLASSKAVAEMKDMSAIIEAQQGFARDFGQKITDAAQAQFATLTEAKEEIQKLAQQSLSVQAVVEEAAPAPVRAPAAAKASRAKRATTAAKD